MINTSILQDLICDRLKIQDFKFVEIESKKRVIPGQVKDLRKYLIKNKKVEHVKSNFFFDQFLDTPQMDLLKLGASMRIRYKRSGSQVYLQYKGPGFIDEGLLYRSEFSSGRLKGIFLEESHHDIIRFTKTSIQKILERQLEAPMKKAMQLHLGAKVVSRISVAPIIGVYQKDKFAVDLGKAFLEPSLDRVFAFHITRSGLHPVSTFCEYENEIKAKGSSLAAKTEHIADLLEFDQKLGKKFSLKPEKLDKYHRCASIFLPKGARRNFEF